MYTNECTKNGKLDLNCIKNNANADCFKSLEGKKCPVFNEFDNIEKLGNGECKNIFSQIRSCLEKNREYELVILKYAKYNNILNLLDKCYNNYRVDENGKRYVWSDDKFDDYPIKYKNDNYYDCEKIRFVLHKIKSEVDGL